MMMKDVVHVVQLLPRALGGGSTATATVAVTTFKEVFYGHLDTIVEREGEGVGGGDDVIIVKTTTTTTATTPHQVSKTDFNNEKAASGDLYW